MLRWLNSCKSEYQTTYHFYSKGYDSVLGNSILMNYKQIITCSLFCLQNVTFEMQTTPMPKYFR